MRKSFTLLTVLFMTLMSMAQGQEDLAGKRISSISVKFKGPQNVARQRILDNMSSKPGQKFDADKIDEDIKNLVKSGLAQNVDIFADPKAKSVRLVVEVDTTSLLAGVAFVNNTKFKDKALLKDVDLKPGTPITDAIILKGRNNILKKYNAFGFPDVVISHRLRPTQTAGYSDLIYSVAEGTRSVVRKIRFANNKSIPSHKLRNLMKTKQKGIFSFLTKSGNIDLDKLEEDRELILEHYRNKGFLRVHAPSFSRIPLKDGRVDLVLNINEGAKYYVNRIAFGPMKVFKAADLAGALTLENGKAYSAEKIREDVKTIRAYYGQKGFADAKVSPETTNAGPNRVNVIYRVSEGKFSRVGKVRIRGNNKTRDQVIRREIPLKPGDNMNTVELETTRKRLRNLNYFGAVDVSSSAGASGYRDIDINVQEKKTGNLAFGLGFSSVDSIVGYVNLEQTNFDIRNPWKFTGGGQRFGLNVRAGAKTQNITLSLTEPWFLGRRLAFGGELYYRGSQFFSDEYDQKNVGGALHIRKPLGKKSYLRAEYRLEQVTIDADSGASAAFKAEEGDFLRSTFSLNYVYDSRDAVTNPRSGHKVDLGVHYSGLGGDVETYGFTAAGSKHWNLWWDSILTLRGNINVVEGLNGKNVQIFERQFLGGSRSLRGFEYRDIGPAGTRDVSGEAVGGNTSAMITAEMTFPVVDRVRVAAFYDAGFVNAKSFDFGTGNIHSDIGLGLRLDLPFGPLALDYAIPLSSPDPLADKGGQFNFYINYEF